MIPTFIIILLSILESLVHNTYFVILFHFLLFSSGQSGQSKKKKDFYYIICIIRTACYSLVVKCAHDTFVVDDGASECPSLRHILTRCNTPSSKATATTKRRLNPDLEEPWGTSATSLRVRSCYGAGKADEPFVEQRKNYVPPEIAIFDWVRANGGIVDGIAIFSPKNKPRGLYIQSSSRTTRWTIIPTRNDHRGLFSEQKSRFRSILPRPYRVCAISRRWLCTKCVVHHVWNVLQSKRNAHWAIPGSVTAFWYKLSIFSVPAKFLAIRDKGTVRHAAKLSIWVCKTGGANRQYWEVRPLRTISVFQQRIYVESADVLYSQFSGQWA